MKEQLYSKINDINIEISKQAAEELKKWKGINDFKPTTASSFKNINIPSPRQIIENNNSDNPTTPKKEIIKENNIYSFGLINIIAALKNSSFYELPNAKILLEKYNYLLLNKNISEAFLIEDFIKELKPYKWEQSVAPILENINEIYNKNIREIEVIKTYENIKNSPGRELFYDALNSMEKWLLSENRNSHTLIYELKKYGFNPTIKNLINFLSLYENNNKNSFNIGYDNNICEVTNIYSPIYIDEDKNIIFYSSGKFLVINEEKGTLQEYPLDKVPDELKEKSNIIIDRNIKIDENKISLYIGKNDRLDIIIENNNKNIYFNNKKITEKQVPVFINTVKNIFFENVNNVISKALYLIKNAEDIIDLDFGKKIKSKIYENVEVNIFKIKDNIYVQLVNPIMKMNKIYETNATQAVNLIKDFIKYDISESLTEFLNKENAILSIMNNDKKQINENIQLLENELKKIEKTKKENPLIANTPELSKLEEDIENEINLLKDKWNQVNVQINNFKNQPSEIISTNKPQSYSLNTPIRIKRNGVKGKIIGVNNISKTYTILFKDGRTGEYFFSEVENINDEIDKYDITKTELTNESKKNKLSSNKKKKKTKKSTKTNISKEDFNFATAPENNYEKIMQNYRNLIQDSISKLRNKK